MGKGHSWRLGSGGRGLSLPLSTSINALEILVMFDSSVIGNQDLYYPTTK